MRIEVRRSAERGSGAELPTVLRCRWSGSSPSTCFWPEGRKLEVMGEEWALACLACACVRCSTSGVLVACVWRFRVVLACCFCLIPSQSFTCLRLSPPRSCHEECGAGDPWLVVSSFVLSGAVLEFARCGFDTAVLSLVWIGASQEYLRGLSSISMSPSSFDSERYGRDLASFLSVLVCLSDFATRDFASFLFVASVLSPVSRLLA